MGIDVENFENKVFLSADNKLPKNYNWTHPFLNFEKSFYSKDKILGQNYKKF